MPEPLEPLEGRVYHYLIDFLAENTYQPSIRDIARKFRIKSTKTVSDLLHSLENKGYIERQDSRSRGVRLIGCAAAGGTQPVPCYDQVHNTKPALRPEHRTESITIDRRFLPSLDVFTVRIDEDAMTGRGLLAGDYVIVSPSSLPYEGDLVAVCVEGKALVRTMSTTAGRVGFDASDPLASPLVAARPEDVMLLGVVCGVFRTYGQSNAEMGALAGDEQAVH